LPQQFARDGQFDPLGIGETDAILHPAAKNAVLGNQVGVAIHQVLIDGPSQFGQNGSPVHLIVKPLIETHLFESQPLTPSMNSSIGVPLAPFDSLRSLMAGQRLKGGKLVSGMVLPNREVASQLRGHWTV